MRVSFFFTCFILLIAACSDPAKKQVDKKKADISDKEVFPIEKDSVGVFNWETDLCKNESTFNARLYTAEELRGTLKLLNMVGSMKLEIDGTAFKPEQIEDLSTLKELDLEYKKKKIELQELKIVNDPFWIKVKKSMLLELKDEYDLNRIGIQAYTNPTILKGNRFSNVCPELIAAITGKDTTLLMTAWKAQVEEQCKTNGSPEYLRKRFEKESHDPDREMYARTELITFGWHNQVNGTLPNLAHDEKINNKFDQLLLKTDSECDEP